MKCCLRQQWISDNSRQSGCHYHICGMTNSHLSWRGTAPRALQTLFSQWRVGEVVSCGVYPRRLKWIDDPRCRFCGWPCETTVHLRSTCPGTANYRMTSGISFSTLAHELPDNILCIASFDAFIWSHLGCDYIRTQPNLDNVIQQFKRKRESTTNTNESEKQSPNKRHKQRHMLIIPHSNLPHCGNKQRRQDSDSNAVDSHKAEHSSRANAEPCKLHVWSIRSAYNLNRKYTHTIYFEEKKSASSISKKGLDPLLVARTKKQ